MTYLQSLERIKRNTEPKFWNAEDIKHYNNIVNALEKQIPKKPLPEREVRSGRIVSFTCPNCNHKDLGNNEFRFNHCEDCGQAIDWSDIK